MAQFAWRWLLRLGQLSLFFLSIFGIRLQCGYEYVSKLSKPHEEVYIYIYTYSDMHSNTRHRSIKSIGKMDLGEVSWFLRYNQHQFDMFGNSSNLKLHQDQCWSIAAALQTGGSCSADPTADLAISTFRLTGGTTKNLRFFSGGKKHRNRQKHLSHSLPKFLIGGWGQISTMLSSLKLTAKAPEGV